MTRMTTGICPICGETEELNTEDVVPQWMRRYAFDAVDGERFTGHLASGKPYDAPVMFQITCKVGEPCNTWMGKTFESPAKPTLVRLIEGTPHTFTPADPELVGRWVAKTALMNVLAGPPPHPDPEIYRAFRRTGDPPPGTRVLLGLFTSPGAQVTPNRVVRVDKSKVPRGTEITVSVFDVVFGQLVVVCWLPVGGPPAYTVAEREGTLVQIWPPTGVPIEWPPTNGFNATDLHAVYTWDVP